MSKQRGPYLKIEPSIESVRERFNSKYVVDEITDCWNWIGATDRYGNFYYKGSRWRAHRASFDMHCEPVPPNMNVLHKCDNTLCVNPKHLFLGTQQDNVDDMVSKNRQCFPGDARRQS